MVTGSVCIHFIREWRPARQPGSAWALNSQFSSLPGDAAELKECVGQRQGTEHCPEFLIESLPGVLPLPLRYYLYCWLSCWGWMSPGSIRRFFITKPRKNTSVQRAGVCRFFKLTLTNKLRRGRESVLKPQSVLNDRILSLPSPSLSAGFVWKCRDVLSPFYFYSCLCLIKNSWVFSPMGDGDCSYFNLTHRDRADDSSLLCSLSI